MLIEVGENLLNFQLAYKLIAKQFGKYFFWV